MSVKNLNKMILKVIYLCLTLIFMSFLTYCKQCKPLKKGNHSKNQKEGWKKVKSPKRGEYMLFYVEKGADLSNPSSEIRFHVLDKKCNKVYEGLIHGGYVKWYDANRLEYFNMPGIMSEDMTREDFVIIYDLKKQQEIKLSELKNSSSY